MDPSLKPEEQGTIKRYLRYADTLINSSEPNDETPADNESVRAVSLLGSRRSTDAQLPRQGDDLPRNGDNSNSDRKADNADKNKKAA